jgi:hypothetical protein
VRYRQALLLLPALAAAPVIHADTLYVVEQLVVSVNSSPDAAGERVASLKSGDSVEVLDKQGEQIHVRLANGTEGWVRKAYLSAEEPLQHRLVQRTAEVEKLKQQVTRLEGELAATRTPARGKLGGVQTGTVAGSPVSPTSSAAPAAPTSVPSPTSASDPPRAEDAASDPTAHEPAYFMTPPDAPARPVWHWALGSFVIALGLGFALGWQVLDRRIRRKYGGLRIY